MDIYSLNVAFYLFAPAYREIDVMKFKQMYINQLISNGNNNEKPKWPLSESKLTALKYKASNQLNELVKQGYLIINKQVVSLSNKAWEDVGVSPALMDTPKDKIKFKH